MSPYKAWAWLFLCCCWIGHQLAVGEEWNYSNLGPDVWPDLYSACGGSEQSPIDISPVKTRFQRFSRFNLSPSYFTTRQFRLLNNGHSISATLVNQSSTLSVTGGGLPGTYRFVNFHFHWGENYASGSEHRV